MRAAALLFALGLGGCEREEAPRRRRYGLPPEVDAARDERDAGAPEGLCVLRGTTGVDLSVGEGRASASVAWSGSQFGVAWREQAGDDASVWFVRASTAGEATSAPVRLTDRGFTPGAPTALWNGANWSVVFAGSWRGADGDLYQARVDIRGVAVSAPWRMTRNARDDSAPFMASNGQGFALAWIAREPDGRRHVLYGQSLNRWGAPQGAAVRLVDTAATLSAPRVTWSGEDWAFTCVSAGREVNAVDFLRLAPGGLPRGLLQHVTPTGVGGVEAEGRYAIAWEGRSYGVVWSELRDGATQVFFRRVSARGNPLGADVLVSEGAAAASEPALVTLSHGVMALAMRVDREGTSRVWVRAVHADGTFQPGHVELQGADGTATSPSMAFDGAGLGVATVGRRGVTFHRVQVGPCAEPAALPRPR